MRRQYMVYDDSGVYLKSIGSAGFVDMISEDQLKEALTTEKSCIIYPIHERAYLLPDNIRNRLRYLFEKMPVLKLLKQEGVCDEEKARCFLTDPTFNRSTTKSIFLNNFPLISEKQLGLLNYHI